MKTKTKVHCVFFDSRITCDKKYKYFRCPACKITTLELRLEELQFDGKITGLSETETKQIELGLHEDVKNGICQRSKTNNGDETCDLGMRCVYCYISMLHKRLCLYIQMSLTDITSLANKIEFQMQLLNMLLTCL